MTVALPVRDEAHRVAPRWHALLAQRGVADLELLVLDDGSTDGTADVVRARRRRRPAASRLLPGTPPPPRAAGQAARLRAARGRGARGACWCSSTPTWCWRRTPSPRRSRCCAAPGSTCCRRGRASSPTVPRPGWCSRCCSGRGWSRCRCGGPSGRRAPALCAANGQFLVVDAAALARAGGFAAVAGEVLDDLAVARAVKRAGGRVGVADGADLAACRMYDGWAELSAGYRKSLWAAFGPAPASAAVAARAGAGLRGAAPGRPARVPGRARRLRRRGGEPGAGRRGTAADARGRTRWPTRCRWPRCSGCWRRRGAGTGGVS